MPHWMFTARKRFTPVDVDVGKRYIAWIGFASVDEIVTLDYSLCSDLIDVPIDSDWVYNVHQNYRTTWFHNLAYLRQRCDWRIGRDQIIAMIDDPKTEQPPPAGFTHCGFDILDGYDSISVLTNCGPFPDFVQLNSVNAYGLLPSLQLAESVAEAMRTKFPEDSHCCDCVVWQIAHDTNPGR